MPRQNSDFSSTSVQCQRALSKWDNEGGAGSTDSDTGPQLDEPSIPDLTSAELVALRVRAIVSENLMIALIATGSDQQLELAGEMTGYIAPRLCFTRHSLTMHAAAHMTDLVERWSRSGKFAECRFHYTS
jgi:hypothetical protein